MNIDHPLFLSEIPNTDDFEHNPGLRALTLILADCDAMSDIEEAAEADAGDDIADLGPPPCDEDEEEDTDDDLACRSPLFLSPSAPRPSLVNDDHMDGVVRRRRRSSSAQACSDGPVRQRRPPSAGRTMRQRCSPYHLDTGKKPARKRIEEAELVIQVRMMSLHPQ